MKTWQINYLRDFQNRWEKVQLEKNYVVEKLENLSDEYSEFLSDNNLPDLSADELEMKLLKGV